MNPIARTLTETLQQVRAVHLPGHRCTDSRWYNHPVKGHECPTAAAMTHAILAVQALDGQVRVAADDPAAVAHVLWAATGFEVDQLSDEDREAWMTTARDAITGLASYLGVDVPPCGHTERVEGCGGCDPSAIEYVIPDGEPLRPFDPALDLKPGPLR